ncbi:TolB family protein [Nocardiopsis nanhaiensis]
MTTPSKLITVEESFGPPVRSRALLSPDGTKAAYLSPWLGRLNVFVRHLDSDWSAPDDVDGSDARRVTANAQRNIEAAFWTTDGRYLLSQQAKNGDENAHLYRVDLTRPEEPEVDLTPDEGVRLMGARLSSDRSGRPSCNSTSAALT